MKTRKIRFVAAMAICATTTQSQDRFPVTRLTIDPDPVGFATWPPDGKMIVYSRIARSDTSAKTGLWKSTRLLKEGTSVSGSCPPGEASRSRSPSPTLVTIRQQAGPRMGK